MAEQARKQKRTQEPAPCEAGQPRAKITEKAKTLKADVERLVDEIDDVLEENAEEFVKSYVQRGGE